MPPKHFRKHSKPERLRFAAVFERIFGQPGRKFARKRRQNAKIIFCIFQDFDLQKSKNPTRNRNTCRMGGSPPPFACRWCDFWSDFLFLNVEILKNTKSNNTRCKLQ